MSLFLRTLRSMSRMVGMGLAPRTWLTMLEQHLMNMEEMESRSLRARPLPGLCTHPEFRRYGNKSGRYSQCLQCHQRFKFNPELQGWEVCGGRSSQHSSPLPLPSPSNTIPAKGRGKTMGSTPKIRPSSRSSISSRTQAVEEQTPWDAAGWPQQEWEDAMHSTPTPIDLDNPDQDEEFNWAGIA